MKKEKKKNLNRDIMMHEAWIEDGRTIGRLKAAEWYLAERLAGLGIHPEDDVEAEPVDPAEREELVRAWVQAADVDAAMSFEQARAC